MAYKYKALKINGKRIDEHRHIMQLHLGRKLLPTEIVRHHDGNTKNNVIENLYVIKKSDQINDQIKKGEISAQIKNALERKSLGIKVKREKWHPKGWVPKPTGRPAKVQNPNITSAVISRSSPIKKRSEKVFENKTAVAPKLIPLKVNKRTTIYIKETTTKQEIDRLIQKYKWQ